MSTHPFLDESFHIRWSRLTPDRIKPDITVALQEAQKRIDAITDQAEEDITFESTFVALEEATEILSHAWGKVSHLQSVEDSKALREAYNAMLPEVSGFYARIPLNDNLWKALKTFADSPDAAVLDRVPRRFVDETMADFRQSGADLPQDKKARLEKLEGELAKATQKFSENVLDATNAFELIIDDESRLKGLPENAKESARRNALSKGHGSETARKWRFTLQAPSLVPFLTYVEDDALRRQVWEASASVGSKEPWDNSGLIREILSLRREKAALLGKPDFADHILERRMAKKGKTALSFVEDLHGRTRPAFLRETESLREFKAEATGSPAEPLEPWEVAFWMEKQRRAQYDFDEEALRPYFPIHRVIDGLFEIARRVFDIEIRERDDVRFLKPEEADPDDGSGIEVWNPEVKFYDLFDPKGIHLGSFYADWHPRESKRGGAWMNYLVTGGPSLDGGGERRPHLGLICGNMTPSHGDKPALLTHDEVLTVFHEFGHLLHHLLGEVEIKSLNGVNVAWDFVELPSQLMENWCWERESLDLFARHFETGDPIPEALYQRMIAARNFGEASAIMRQLSFAKMDLELHMFPEKFGEGDLEKKVRQLLAEYVYPTKTPAPTIMRRFNHIFGSSTGYAAGYYSYKWAEVLDADVFTRFQAEGVFNRRVGREYVEKILSRGNSEEPMKLFKDFMGREPDLEALLRRSGLSA